MNTGRATVARGTGRDVLLDATLRLIGERGLHAITLREVAAAAGLSLGSTTYHFADRDALLIAALSRFADSVVEQCDTALARPELDTMTPRELMAAVFADFSASYCEPTRMLAQLEMYTESARNPIVAAISDRCMAAYRRLLVRAFAAAGLPDAETDARIAHVMVYADGLALQSAAKGTPCELQADAPAVIWALATASI
ncbi:TetR/AcrR family transcriptional regulator [Williamsia sp. MIQD14]|uniref:TetR/AcrR family transcriptional regulator n=1 Tax=Williamsia sp. MIQD14 TaxID=3425703 RepID=UPI003DA122A5